MTCPSLRSALIASYAKHVDHERTLGFTPAGDVYQQATAVLHVVGRLRQRHRLNCTAELYRAVQLDQRHVVRVFCV